MCLRGGVGGGRVSTLLVEKSGSFASHAVELEKMGYCRGWQNLLPLLKRLYKVKLKRLYK